MPLPHDTVDFERRLAAIAEDTRRHLLGDVAVLEKIVDSASIVFGTWFDFNRPSGIGKLLLKGERELRRAMHLGRQKDATMIAIPVADAEQAEVLKRHIEARHNGAAA